MEWSRSDRQERSLLWHKQTSQKSRVSAHKDQPEVIVDHLAGGAQREVRGDKSARAGELTFVPVYAPHHRAMLQNCIRTFAEEALPDCAEPERVVRIAKANCAGLAKGGFSGERHFGLERCFLARYQRQGACHAAGTNVQLGAMVETMITPDTPAFGAALPLNCIAYMFHVGLFPIVVAKDNAAAQLTLASVEPPRLGYTLPLRLARQFHQSNFTSNSIC